MVFSLRLIHVAFRLTSLLACVMSIATGATLPLSNNGGNPNRIRFIGRSTSTGRSAESSDAVAGLRWNIDDQRLPLLGVTGDSLKRGFDQSLSYPLDQFGFPIFQALNYDDEHGRYLLPTLSREGNGVHFIEFESSATKNTFISIDGSNIHLVDNDNMKTIRTADGAKYTFVRYPDGEFRCAVIKDSRGAYLNLIYAANGLTLHGIVDSAGRTITFNYSSDGIMSVTQNWMANSEGVSRTWTVGEPVPATFANDLKAYSFAAVKTLPTNALLREYTSDMAASDKLLAQIFGGPNAVAAGNGFEPPGLAAAYPLYRGDIMGDDGIERRGHLSYAMHLYGNFDGTGESSLYVPPGFASHSGQPSPTDAVVTFFYPRLGNLTDVTLAVFHVADFQISNEGERIRIGNLGGPGGISASYKHTHIEFYRGNSGLPPLTARPRLRIDPATVFATAPAGR